jgi:transposase
MQNDWSDGYKYLIIHMYLDITWIRILIFEFISKFLKKLKLIYPKIQLIDYKYNTYYLEIKIFNKSIIRNQIMLKKYEFISYFRKNSYFCRSKNLFLWRM